MRIPIRALARVLVFTVVSIVALGPAKATGASADVAARPTIVLVHGAWGGGWAFKKLEQLLRREGVDVYRPTLTGLGERMHLGHREVGLSTHVDDIVNVLLFEDLHDVVLVGHSYGGMVITGVADRVPARIRRLVYVDAFVPGDGESVMSLVSPHGAWVEDMVKDGMMVPSWPGGPPWPRDVPQSFRTFTDTLSLENTEPHWPATYLLTVEAGKQASKDDFFLQSERARTRGWTVIRMTASHNPQHDAAAQLAELLLKEARRSAAAASRQSQGK
jgi:pimeloyl-ACP methyl ester carboxylesterase